MEPVTREQLQDFESKLKILDLVVKLGWALLVGAFMLGTWVAAIQIAINRQTESLRDVKDAIGATNTTVRNLEIKDSADTQLLRSIVEKLDKIDNKLNP
jgi:hypothetical protein